ncbi:MAG TPA: ABC transporter substrate-binding protein [Thermoplasmata archaeon]|nr:ABC transporter substrate-binding protein [Thermoplasmata archaeon]
MSLNPESADRRPAGVTRTVLVVSLLVAAGISVAATAAYFELRPTPAPPGTVAVTDDTGRTVNVPADPSRVVVLSPSITDSMVRLGLRERIVGVDCYAQALGGLSADYSPAQIHNWSLSSNLCVQTGPSFSVEQLLNASPDLVLTSTIVSASTVEEISTTYHIPVLILQPSTLGGIVVDIQLLAQIFHVATAASTLVGQLQSVLGRAAALQANLSANGTPFPSVLLTYYADNLGFWTYGPGTFGQSLVELVSAVSVAANATLAYPEVSGSQVLVADPSAIVYATGFGVNLTVYSQGPNWAQFGAVSSGHLYPIASELLTEPGPTMILVTVPTLLAILHPGPK